MKLENFYEEAKAMGNIEVTDSFLEAWIEAINDEPSKIEIGHEVVFHGMEYMRRGSISWLIYGEVIAVTDKAIQVKQNIDKKIVHTWVPKSAYYNLEWDQMDSIWSADLKRWFCSKK